MTSASAPKSRNKINWAPYLLILPSLLYLAAFFGWPMVQGLILAVREEGALLTLRSEAERDSTITGQLPRGIQVGLHLGCSLYSLRLYIHSGGHSATSS